jgi:purine-cytosine permease-like protein
MILGTAAMATTLSGDPTTNRFLIGYDNNSVGGLVYEILVDQSLNGFGQFCMVLLAISTVANNVPNMYSLGLSAQTVWTGFRRIPRVIWTILGCGISVAIAIPAYLHFSTAMQNFMDLIGYWLAIYSGVALTDHFVYKRGKFSSYDADLYDNKKELAIGISAIFAFCAGVAGAALGMSQVWYVGVLARKIGDPTFGGDIGFELAFGFSAIVYLSTRWIEMKYIR